MNNKTIHDVALGLFVSGIYGLWSGNVDVANLSLASISFIALVIINQKGECNDNRSNNSANNSSNNTDSGN